VYFNCGRVMAKNCRTRPAPSSCAASNSEAESAAPRPGRSACGRVRTASDHEDDHERARFELPSQSWAKPGILSPGPSRSSGPTAPCTRSRRRRRNSSGTK